MKTDMSNEDHAEYTEQGHDTTPYLESDDGSHRPHVGDAIALFSDLRELF